MAGLLVNSASTMAFGTLRNPTAMCLAKLLSLRGDADGWQPRENNMVYHGLIMCDH